MISTVLAILKILGIILLVILGILIVLLLLALFVPVRYQILARRINGQEAPVTVHIKITWLLHLLNAAFSYPEAAFLKVRIACITVFRSDKPPGGKSGKEKSDSKAGEKPAARSKKQPPPEPESTPDADKKESKSGRKISLPEPGEERKQDAGPVSEPEEEIGLKKIMQKILEFIRKLTAIFKNIRYTIAKIYDKIKDIVNNIQYYVNIIKSDTFKGAWKVCSAQALLLLKHILPGKIEGKLHIGTGDPASTGQVLAVYGILYPFAGNHIDIVPDFEQQIIEGELFIKGRITLFKGLKTAWIIYFNKDLRRLIKLFKREAA